MTEIHVTDEIKQGEQGIQLHVAFDVKKRNANMQIKELELKSKAQEKYAKAKINDRINNQ